MDETRRGAHHAQSDEGTDSSRLGTAPRSHAASAVAAEGSALGEPAGGPVLSHSLSLADAQPSRPAQPVRPAQQSSPVQPARPAPIGQLQPEPQDSLPFDDPRVGVDPKDVRPVVVHRPSLPTALLSALLGALLALGGAYVAVQSGVVSVGARAAQPTIGATGPALVDSQVSAPDWAAVAAAVKPSTVSVRASGNGDGSQGAGFILDEDGHILTNTHVVAGQSSYSVVLDSSIVVDAHLVGVDNPTDIAVLQMDNPPSGLAPASLGDSDSLVVGQAVAAIGNPLGLSQSMSAGIISALDRPVTTVESQETGRDTMINAIQIDASTNEGNSGGALFDAEGRIVGVTSALARETSGDNAGRPVGIGFAIPVNLAKKIAAQLIDNGVAAHAALGVNAESVWVRVDGVSRLGAHVVGVDTGSSAARGGILVDDTIVAVNGAPVVSANSLTGTVREYQPGDVVTVTVVRGGKAFDLDVALAG